jgi:CheY-like chemotaxis protein
MAKILLVEDMQDALDACALILRLAGHAVLAARSPTLAIQSYAEQHQANTPFDLVILDLAMPAINGFEVAAQIRSLDPNARIVFLTAFDDPLSVGRAESSGALGYWSKPIAAPTLIQNVARVLERADCAPP